MKNNSKNQNADATRTIAVASEDEERFLMQAQSLYREIHCVARKADPKTMIDDAERAVVFNGGKLLKGLLETTVNQEIKKAESEDERNCPHCKGERKIRNQGAKKNSSYFSGGNRASAFSFFMLSKALFRLFS